MQTINSYSCVLQLLNFKLDLPRTCIFWKVVIVIKYCKIQNASPSKMQFYCAAMSSQLTQQGSLAVDRAADSLHVLLKGVQMLLKQPKKGGL